MTPVLAKVLVPFPWPRTGASVSHRSSCCSALRDRASVTGETLGSQGQLCTGASQEVDLAPWSGTLGPSVPQRTVNDWHPLKIRWHPIVVCEEAV
jgi:hypothetical protein